MAPIISVSNVSKQYRLGEVGTGSLQQDLNRWWHKLRGKDDPYLQVGDTNNRSTRSSSNYVWALRNISFEVQPGEVLGIIGRNGAGKSTLLKILSRITEPTTGSIAMQGRVASLLEVGTGMHPDLTGRENIYLNGAILGMTKKEITRKFDEIVDFAGVERYIDTPVKRYSSGMHVRLGFAVAAHLEPDILIVDEVLAVGDAEFQKKCLGKMREVSQADGRTILFVSHNLTAIKSICNKGLLLHNGTAISNKNVAEVVDEYLKIEKTQLLKEWSLSDAPGTTEAKLLYAGTDNDTGVFFLSEPLNITFKVWIKEQLQKTERNISFSLVVATIDGQVVFNVGSEILKIAGSTIETTCHIPANFLNDEFYTFRILLVEDTATVLFDIHNILQIKIEEKERNSAWHGKWLGVVRPTNIINWTQHD